MTISEMTDKTIDMVALFFEGQPFYIAEFDTEAMTTKAMVDGVYHRFQFNDDGSVTFGRV